MFKLLKSKLFLYLIVIGLLASTAQITYVSLKNPKATTISVRDYLKTKPDVQWVVLTDLRLNLNKAVYSTGRTRTIKDVYIPVESLQPDSPKSNLFVRTDSKDIKKAMNLGKKSSRSKQENEEFLKIAAKWSATRSVKGLVQVGLDSDSDIETQIKKLSGLSSVNILKLNDRPLPWYVGLIAFVLGIALLIYLLKKKPAQYKKEVNA